MGIGPEAGGPAAWSLLNRSNTSSTLAHLPAEGRSSPTSGTLSGPKALRKQHGWERSAACRPVPCWGRDQYPLAPLAVVLMPPKRFHNRNNYKPVMKIADLPWSKEVLGVQLGDKRKQSRGTLGSALLLKMSCLCYCSLIVTA